MWWEIVGSVGQARLKSHEPTARGPSRHTARVRASPSSRACKELVHPTPLWLGFIVVWTNCGLDPLWFGKLISCSTYSLVQQTTGSVTSLMNWNIVEYAIC